MESRRCIGKGRQSYCIKSEDKVQTWLQYSCVSNESCAATFRIESTKHKEGRIHDCLTQGKEIQKLYDIESVPAFRRDPSPEQTCESSLKLKPILGVRAKILQHQQSKNSRKDLLKHEPNKYYNPYRSFSSLQRGGFLRRAIRKSSHPFLNKCKVLSFNTSQACTYV